MHHMHQAGRETTIPGTAHSPAWGTSSRAEQLDFCSEDFDHVLNGSGYEKFPIIPYSTENKFKLLSLLENKIKQ